MVMCTHLRIYTRVLGLICIGVGTASGEEQLCLDIPREAAVLGHIQAIRDTRLCVRPAATVKGKPTTEQ